MIPGELTEIGGLRKTRIALEGNEIEAWALRRSKEDTFLYPTAISKSKSGRKDLQNIAVKSVNLKLSDWSIAEAIRFEMVL
jgi:hypothetical protein